VVYAQFFQQFRPGNGTAISGIFPGFHPNLIGEVREMNKRLIIFLCAVLIINMVGCNTKPQSTSLLDSNDKSVQETLAVIAAWQTQEAMPTATPEPATATPTDTLVPTAEPTQTSTFLPPTETPLPSETPTVTLTATSTATSTPIPGLEDKIKSANILIYEDMGENNLVPRIDRALSLLNLWGGKVINTHTNLPLFTNQLKSGIKWDLIIINAEGRNNVHLGTLGVYNDIVHHVENGGALIVEYWNMDEDGTDLTSYIEDKCAIRVEKNWVRLDNTDTKSYADYLLYDLNQNLSVLFTYPFKINMPMYPSPYWQGDIGDLIVKMPGSNAQFATGLVSKDPNHYGVITTCNHGKLLLQTFGTHDYRLFETTELWANYIHFTLSNYFNPPPY
jgi:hypothetical protein